MQLKFKLMLTSLLGMLLTAPLAYGDDAQDADDPTITVVGEGDTPDDIVKMIELPEHAAAVAATKSASGNSNANAGNGNSNANAGNDKSGESGRDFGQQVSEEARSNNAAQVRDDAQQQANSDARNDNASDKRHTPHN